MNVFISIKLYIILFVTCQYYSLKKDRVQEIVTKAIETRDLKHPFVVGYSLYNLVKTKSIIHKTACFIYGTHCKNLLSFYIPSFWLESFF